MKDVISCSQFTISCFKSVKILKNHKQTHTYIQNTITTKCQHKSNSLTATVVVAFEYNYCSGLSAWFEYYKLI